jgi:uncharacterized membrane protein YfcA
MIYGEKMSSDLKEQDYSQLLMEFKQICALLFVTGVALGSYVVLMPSSNILMFIFTILIVIYAAYAYYRKDKGKIGILLLILAIMWAVTSIPKYFMLY